MIKLFPLIFLLVCSSCLRTPNLRKPNSRYEMVTDTSYEVIIGISMYDTIAPPKLITDSVKLFTELSELLKFSSKLEYREDRIASYELVVDIDGKILSSRKLWITKDIEAEMIKAINFLLTTAWEPAFLKESPSTKATCPVKIIFDFYRDRIQFAAYAPEYHPLFKKTFDPHYSKVE